MKTKKEMLTTLRKDDRLLTIDLLTATTTTHRTDITIPHMEEIIVRVEGG